MAEGRETHDGVARLSPEILKDGWWDKFQRLRVYPKICANLVNTAIRHKKYSYVELANIINDKLTKRGLSQTVSKSALHRHGQAVQRLQMRLSQSHEVLEKITQNMGNMPDGKQGRLLIELVRCLSFGVIFDATEKGDEVSLGQIAQIALILQRLEKSDKMNAQREQEIRDQARTKAAADVKAIANKQGISQER